MARTKRYYNPSSKLEERAQQAWIILVGLAAQRQTIRYADLAMKMFHSKALRQMGKILGHVSHHCEQHKYPHLNCIVVNTSGRPGTGIPEDSDLLREQVFEFDWYDVIPPSAADFKAAWDATFGSAR